MREKEKKRCTYLIGGYLGGGGCLGRRWWGTGVVFDKIQRNKTATADD